MTKAAKNIAELFLIGKFNQVAIRRMTEDFLNHYYSTIKMYNHSHYEYKRVSKNNNGCGINTTKVFIQIFAKKDEREDFESQFVEFDNAEQLAILTESVLRSIRYSHEYGEAYFIILKERFLSNLKVSDDDVIYNNESKFSRATYFRRKPEAIDLFGLLFYKNVILNYRLVNQV